MALVLASGCGGGEEPSARPPGDDPANGSPSDPLAAGRGGAKPVPEGELRGEADRGKQVYDQYCWTCHGRGGRGDGPTASGLVPKPADHTDPEYMGQLSDADLYRVIRDGGASVGRSPLMAPWGGVINDSDIRDLIGYLRQLSGT
jgi:mono/diheme cytochrome c family protein